MSIDLIKKKINDFLKTDMPEVMAIKGKWGVGKTFLWKDALKNTKDTEIKLERYSYVADSNSKCII